MLSHHPVMVTQIFGHSSERQCQYCALHARYITSSAWGGAYQTCRAHIAAAVDVVSLELRADAILHDHQFDHSRSLTSERA
jgi:hypothetical protein